MNFLDDRLPERFWRRLSPCPITGCWLWTGPVNANGYGAHGRRAMHSGSQLTHRFTYEALVGALPLGTEIDHRVCRTRSCANPVHLEAVPHLVNVRRGEAKKTHCKRGHSLVDGNLMPTSVGARCRACANADGRERKRSVYVKRVRKRKAFCKYGHVKADNGKRMVCTVCPSLRNHKHQGATT